MDNKPKEPPPKKHMFDKLTPEAGCLHCGHIPYEYVETPEGFKCKHCGWVTQDSEEGDWREH